MKISVYGLGQFGYALLKHLDVNNNGRYDLYAHARNLDLLSYLRQVRFICYYNANYLLILQKT